MAIIALDKSVSGLTITPMPALDATRKLYQVGLRTTEVPRQCLLARGEAAVSALCLATLEATSAVCAELVGVMIISPAAPRRILPAGRDRFFPGSRAGG